MLESLKEETKNVLALYKNFGSLTRKDKVKAVVFAGIFIFVAVYLVGSCAYAIAN